MEGTEPKPYLDFSPYCLRDKVPPAQLELARVGLPREFYTVYYLFGVPHLPHYKERGMFVAPGGNALSEATLNAIGAVPAKRELWKREY